MRTIKDMLLSSTTTGHYLLLPPSVLLSLLQVLEDGWLSGNLRRLA